MQPFTDISFFEIQSEDTRAYHVRYSGNAGVDLNLASKLLVEGVQGISAQPYQVTIVKSPAYSWEEIEKEIKEILLEFEADIKDGFIGEEVGKQPRKGWL